MAFILLNRLNGPRLILYERRQKVLSWGLQNDLAGIAGRAMMGECVFFLQVKVKGRKMLVRDEA